MGKRIVVTGYAGFIGSNLTRMLLNDSDIILGIDCHTYAARPFHVWNELKDSDSRFIDSRVDIRDFHRLAAVLEDFKPDEVYHLAAESHVCRSIEGPRDFATTNFMGTFNLIEALRRMEFDGRLVHVSTDEAFGELRKMDPPFDEMTPTDPRSPYSASKAASDLMVRAYARTYGLNFCITRCTNNYGPNQHDEKLIPRTITKIMGGQPMTIHGDGTHSRDWIWVGDHCEALMTVMAKGQAGHLYCIGGGIEMENREIVQWVKTALDIELSKDHELAIVFTNDRPTDDHRYAVDTSKIEQLGWKPNRDRSYLAKRLRETVRWYAENL